MTSHPRPLPSWRRATLFALLTGLWFVAGLAGFGWVLLSSGYPGRAILFKMDAAETASLQAPGRVVAVAQGPQGIWVRTLFKCYACRFDGQNWTTHRAPFREPGNRSGGAIAVGESAVYLNTRKALWRLNRGQWTAHPFPLESFTVDALAVEDDTCLALTRRGELWRFDANSWTQVTTLPETWQVNDAAQGLASDGFPRTKLTVDHAQRIWVGRLRTAFFDGKSWQSVADRFDQLASAEFLGLVDGRPYFEVNDRLWTLNGDQAAEVVEIAGLNWGADERPVSVGRAPQGPFLVTSQRIVSLDGSFPEQVIDPRKLDNSLVQAAFGTADRWWVQGAAKPNYALIWSYSAIASLLSWGVWLGGRRLLGPSIPLKKSTLGLALLAVVGAGVVNHDTIPLESLQVWLPSSILALSLILPLSLAMTSLLKLAWGRTLEYVDPTPVDERSLSEEAREFLDSQAELVSQLGFRVIGDFRLKKSHEYVTRTCLNPECNVLAEITYVQRRWAATKGVSFVSLMSDGMLIESATLHVPTPRQRYQRLIMLGFPGQSAADVLGLHMSMLEQMQDSAFASGLDCEPLTLADDSVAGVIRYGQKLLYEQLRLDGTVSGPNPFELVPFPKVDESRLMSVASHP